MKKCPYCAEEIQGDAVICRFCNRKLKTKPLVSLTVLIPALLVAVSMYGLYSYMHAEVMKKEYQTAKAAEFQKLKILAVTACRQMDGLAAWYRSGAPLDQAKDKVQQYALAFQNLKSGAYDFKKGFKSSEDKVFFSTIMTAVTRASDLSEALTSETNYAVETAAAKKAAEELRKKATELADYYRETGRDQGQENLKMEAVKLYEKADREEKALAGREQAEEKAKLVSKEAFQAFESSLTEITKQASSLGLDPRELLPSFAAQIEKDRVVLKS